MPQTDAQCHSVKGTLLQRDTKAPAPCATLGGRCLQPRPRDPQPGDLPQPPDGALSLTGDSFASGSDPCAPSARPSAVPRAVVWLAVPRPSVPGSVRGARGAEGGERAGLAALPPRCLRSSAAPAGRRGCSPSLTHGGGGAQPPPRLLPPTGWGSRRGPEARLSGAAGLPKDESPPCPHSAGLGCPEPHRVSVSHLLPDPFIFRSP